MSRKSRDPERDTEMDVSLLRSVNFKLRPRRKQLWVYPRLYNMNAATKRSLKRASDFDFGGYRRPVRRKSLRAILYKIFRNHENGIDYRLEVIALKGAPSLFTNHVRSSSRPAVRRVM